MELNLLSKYRSQLMGLAIIWIILFHSNLDVSYFKIFDLIKSIGNAGVDIFMFVSGFGIYYSLSKGVSIKTFYKNRLRRILPYYLPIVIIFSLYLYYKGFWDVDIVIKNILLLSYWTIPDLTKVFDWYIPAILVIYVAVPLFYYFYKKSKIISTLSVIIFFYILSFLVIDTPFATLQLVTMRIPTFVIGFCIADYSQNHKNAKLSPLGILLCILGLIVGFGFLHYLFYYFPDQFSHYAMYGFALFIFPLCMFYVYFFSLFSKYKFPILNFLGKNTLYLYIFHERILKILELNEIGPYTDWLAFVLTFIMAIGWSKFVDYVISRFESPKVL